MCVCVCVRACVCVCVTHYIVYIFTYMHLCICTQQEAKLSAAKSKMDQMVTAQKEDFQSTLEEKDAKICALEEEVRDLQRAADQQRSWVCTYN